MLVPWMFDTGEVIFEIVKPFNHNATRELIESDNWIILIRPGSVHGLACGPLLDTKTRTSGRFNNPTEALKAAIDFAHACGLRNA